MKTINAIGIDYSASQNPAKKIWISECVLQDNLIILNQSYSLKEKIGSNTLKNCNDYLVNLVKNNKNYSFGFDFSFSIPQVFIEKLSWDEFILEFSERWKSADDFKKDLSKRASSTEIKRFTEIEANVPFSTYNLWIYKQTYYGISEILSPLLQTKCCTILPFHSSKKEFPKILETCPASFLKNISTTSDYSKKYKGSTENHFNRRKLILDFLESRFNLSFKEVSLKKKILQNRDGDALDSLICAIIVLKWSINNYKNKLNLNFKNEGFIYY